MTSQRPLTILQNLGIYEDYPFEAIDPEVLARFLVDGQRLTKHLRKSVNKTLKALECYLQITGQRITKDTVGGADTSPLWRGFIGALFSDSFYESQSNNRWDMATTALHLSLSSAGDHRDLVSRDWSLLPECIEFFAKMPLNPTKVWLWSGWPSRGITGKTTWFPLHPVYLRLGRRFTDALHRQLDAYHGARRGARVTAVKELAKFIGDYQGLNEQDLQNPLFVTKFWREFFVYYITEGYESGVQPSVLLTGWSSNFVTVVRKYLTHPELFAEPWGSVPRPRAAAIGGHQTNIRRNRREALTCEKLLTTVPLGITDEAALHLIIKGVQADFDCIRAWADKECEELWQRHLEVKELAKLGTVRPWPKLGNRSADESHLMDIIDRSNPKHLHNAAATLLHYGYPGPNIINLFPNPRRQSAWELAMPITGALLPHCAVLVAEHPSITPAFLERLELYDKGGRLVGFISSNTGSRLISYKFRRGAHLAQQIIELSPRAAEVVRQVIAITEPVREYMRKENNDEWRYLFITCGSAFGGGRRVTRFATDTSDSARVRSIADGIHKFTDLDPDSALELAQRFTLRSLRASAGVIVYFKTKSVTKMAEALGHIRYDHKLIGRYLPQPLTAFFQDRWIRIFQTAIVVEALKDSRYLKEASGLKTKAELREFLQNHVIRTLPNEIDPSSSAQSKPSSGHSNSEIVFGVSPEILTLLLELRSAVDLAGNDASAWAQYWADIGDRLIRYLETAEHGREDLNVYLADARSRVQPNRLRDFVYA